ncbi:MAG: sugar phosphate isomerase/epimerase family protein, partial [Planctomycetota bacterium]
RAHADGLGLYSHVSVAGCNPHLVDGPLAEHIDSMKRQVELAAGCGWHELHSTLGSGRERYEHPVPWEEHLADSADLIRQLGPVLREHGSRIDLETHGDTTTFELVRLAECVGGEIAGICLDTANVLCHGEDPVWAARRAAPYTHLTHTKDAIIFLADSGYRRQTLPAGRGALDWREILPILAEYSPDLPISIEDHKWLFDYDVFDPRWLELHPDLTREELARVLATAWQCHKRILSGELPDPEEYEKIPFLEELEVRLARGRDYLTGLIEQLRLEG